MTYSNLLEAIAEAERFLKRAKELKRATVERCTNRKRLFLSPYDANVGRAAVLRSSMDLTRTLARLRRER